MPTKTATLSIGLFAMMLNATAQKPAFTAKEYGNVANYFGSEAGFVAFFDFHKDDVVAEVGAGSGKNIVGFSIVASDSLTFYAQDIDRSCLNAHSLEKIIRRAAKYKKASGNSYRLCIGSETATGLPDGMFDKLILVSTLHEFTRMDEMLADIRRKLKPDGLLYILEAHCLAKGHRNYTPQEISGMLEQNGFTAIKIAITTDSGAPVYQAVFKKELF